MRILHLSDSGLPDWRIEKAATTGLKAGHEVVFGGEKKASSYDRRIFFDFYEIIWSERSRRGIPIYWHTVKKQVGRMLRDVRPDLVHAHDIFAAKMISEFGVPFVYDSHEYWSEYTKILIESNRSASRNVKSNPPKKILRELARHFLNNYTLRLWRKWEEELVSHDNPTITVSDEIAEKLRSRNNSNNTINRIFVVPNFPMKSEVEGFKKPQHHDRLSCVYAGLSRNDKVVPSHRNLDGLTDAFNNNQIGDLTLIGGQRNKSIGNISHLSFLPREAMYKEMFKHSIGLIPWRRHWFHTYANPNKAYEYAHAGLFVMCPSSLRPVVNTLKEHCDTFDDYADMVSRLTYFRDNLDELYNKRLKTFAFAGSNLIWERHEQNIIQAYQLC